MKQLLRIIHGRHNGTINGYRCVSWSHGHYLVKIKPIQQWLYQVARHILAIDGHRFVSTSGGCGLNGTPIPKLFLKISKITHADSIAQAGVM